MEEFIFDSLEDQPANWLERNQQYLVAALQRVSSYLEALPEKRLAEPLDAPAAGNPAALPGQPATALDQVCAVFGLTPFERDILLLCAGVELDSAFGQSKASGQAGSQLKQPVRPTFSLAMSVLPEAHWSALTPASPLRRWQLIKLGDGETLTTSTLHIEERVLHYLTGVNYLDERLHGLVEPVPPGGELPTSLQRLAESAAQFWLDNPPGQPWPVISLCGERDAGKHDLAAEICALTGLSLYSLKAGQIPANPADREALARLWEREAALSRSALLLDLEDLDAPEMTRTALRAAALFASTLQSALITVGLAPPALSWSSAQAGFGGSNHRRGLVRVEVDRPGAAEQRLVWQSALGPRLAELKNGKHAAGKSRGSRGTNEKNQPAFSPGLEGLVSQFRLSPANIRRASAEALAAPDGQPLPAALWEASRRLARPELDDLAQRIQPAAAWDDLILPPLPRQTLAEIAAHVRQRARVYEDWGMAARSARSLGISALFVGASGTGKTMAAEVLANELHLDLYRIDLSSVVSKYIGETEKNLRRVFDAAEDGGCLLLFDEADALFGRRSEVKDSHDRYANIEVSYLLQRMEAFRGLAILTTNLKANLDSAFLRRIRFVVDFPFPDESQRAEIWRHIYPPETPVQDLEMAKLARLSLAGGNIRNIALNAAFLAADAGEPVRMRHLLAAARSEYAKLEKRLTDAEVADWIQ